MFSCKVHTQMLAELTSLVDNSLGLQRDVKRVTSRLYSQRGEFTNVYNIYYSLCQVQSCISIWVQTSSQTCNRLAISKMRY